MKYLRRVGAFGVALVAACGSDAGVGPAGDDIPPATVSDLRVESTAPGRATLRWTAPGDDQSIGRAARYDIRYSRTELNGSTWDSASVVASPPDPQSAGASESFSITGLGTGLWYFVLRAADEVPNWSGLSNLASAQVVAATPPLRVTDLRIESSTPSSVTLTWTAPGDEQTGLRASAYDLRYSLTLISEGTWGVASPVPGLPAPSAPGRTERFEVTGLAPSTSYFFAIRASDAAGGWSDLSPVVRESTPAGTLTRLTSSREAPGASFPAWSPDGRWIVFSAEPEGRDEYQLFLIEAGGGEPVQLTSGYGAYQPAWSPDGEKLAFVSFQEDPGLPQQLSVVDAVPGALPAVVASHEGHNVGSPSWSPDGTRIAYHVVVSFGGGIVTEIYTVGAEGGVPELLVGAAVNGGFPSWSPDGKQILFSTNAGDRDLYAVPASGGDPRRLTATSAAESGPAMSPDGSRIAFTSNAAGNRDIWVMSATGENPVRLTTSPDNEDSPDWAPDGSAISLVRQIDGIRDIWVLRLR